MSDALLQVEDLSVAYGGAPAVREVSFDIDRGEAYGLVGESGSGKTTLAMAIMRYLPGGGRVDSGRICFNGEDVLAFGSEALRDFRGGRQAIYICVQFVDARHPPPVQADDNVIHLDAAMRRRAFRLQIRNHHAVIGLKPQAFGHLRRNCFGN